MKRCDRLSPSSSVDSHNRSGLYPSSHISRRLFFLQPWPCSAIVVQPPLYSLQLKDSLPFTPPRLPVSSFSCLSILPPDHRWQWKSNVLPSDTILDSFKVSRETRLYAAHKRGWDASVFCEPLQPHRLPLPVALAIPRGMTCTSRIGHSLSPLALHLLSLSPGMSFKPSSPGSGCSPVLFESVGTALVTSECKD